MSKVGKLSNVSSSVQLYWELTTVLGLYETRLATKINTQDPFRSRANYLKNSLDTWVIFQISDLQGKNEHNNGGKYVYLTLIFNFCIFSTSHDTAYTHVS